MYQEHIIDINIYININKIQKKEIGMIRDLAAHSYTCVFCLILTSSAFRVFRDCDQAAPLLLQLQYKLESLDTFLMKWYIMMAKHRVTHMMMFMKRLACC